MDFAKKREKRGKKQERTFEGFCFALNQRVSSLSGDMIIPVSSSHVQEKAGTSTKKNLEGKQRNHFGAVASPSSYVSQQRTSDGVKKGNHSVTICSLFYSLAQTSQVKDQFQGSLSKSFPAEHGKVQYKLSPGFTASSVEL